MNLAPALFLAEVGHPLFGNQWLALGAVLIGVAAFMAGVAVAGRWLARTHPATPPALTPAAPLPQIAPPAEPGMPPEVLALIAAAVAVTMGPRARITAVEPVKMAPSIENLMQQWSLEGRRQIYSSHQIR